VKPRRYRLVHYPISEDRAWIIQGNGDRRGVWVDVARFRTAQQAREFLHDILSQQYALIEAGT
jgi:hypothetical protein